MSCNLNTVGGLTFFCDVLFACVIMLWSSKYISVHACYNSPDTNLNHAFKFFNILWSCMIGFQDIGGDLHNFNLPCAFAIQIKSCICTSSGWVPQISCNQCLHIMYLHFHYFIPVQNLTDLSSITKKGEIVSASSAPLLVLEYWRQISWGTNEFVSVHRKE
jgi:hypothetical protein